MSRGSRTFAVIASIALCGAALSPLLRRPADDGFPLSTYPMFARPRPRQLTMSYPLGVTADGGRRTLSPALIGSSEVLQALAIVERAVARRGAALQGLCQAIARRVAASPAYEDVVAIRLVTGTHDAVELLVRERIGAEIERGRCAVSRSGG
jgi:hypothetical protein